MRRHALQLALALLAAAACHGAPRAGGSPQGRAVGPPPAADRRDAPFTPPGPVTCESFAAVVDNELVEWQNAGDATHFIVIVRPGSRERAGLGRSRLREVESYLGRRTKRNKNYVVAEGGRTRGAGTVEVYVAGRLRAAIPLKKNDRHVCSGKVNPFM